MYTKAKRRGQCKVGSHKIRGYRVTRKVAGTKKTVSYSVRTYCRALAKGTTSGGRPKSRPKSRPSQSGKPCFTKTGIKKPALKSTGRCPSGTDRRQARKDAHTARKGGYPQGKGNGPCRVKSGENKGQFKKC